MKIPRLCLLAISIFLAACAHRDIQPENQPNLRALSDAELAVSYANNDFAFNLFRDIQNQHPGDNVFISPLSVSMALGMTLNGAGASTRKSILNTIQFGNLQPVQVDQAFKDLTDLLTNMDRTVEFDLANSVWYAQQYTVRDSFTAVIQNYYYGKVQGLDFTDPASPQTINSWVAGKTNQEIKNLISTIDPSEVMFLINAVYFKGDWTYQFDKSQTQAGDFIKENGSILQAQMMLSKGTKLTEFVHRKFFLVDIPYGNKQFSMTILEPFGENTVQQISTLLSADSLDFWLNHADTASIELTMPKFNMEWKNDLKGNLENLGMAISGFPHLFEQSLSLEIGHVIHQSNISVDESGSEAAAATAVGIQLTAFPSSPPRVDINRPFLYFIREKHSGVILFMGQLYSPPDK